MVRIFPFNGIIYNKKKLKNLAKVMAPPYDVISPEYQEELYGRSDFNFIRLILGKEFASDTIYNNRYVRASAFLQGWLRHKIMLKDDQPNIYVYEQKFKAQGKTFSRVGFIALLRLEEMGRGKVYPHEYTYPKAKLDRLQLMRAANANFESIFTLYSDKKEKIVKTLKAFMKRQPTIEAKDELGTVHRLWRVDRLAAINKVIQEMKDKAVYIADGHHRYEAALRFRDERKKKNTKFSEEEAYNHIMMYFTPLEGTGLVVLPIHRVVLSIPFFDQQRFEEELRQYYEITVYQATKKTADATRKKLMKDLAKAGEKSHAFGLYLGDNRFLLLALKADQSVNDLVEEDKPKVWKELDANVLHYTVFSRVLRIAHETEDKLVYTQKDEEAVKMVDDKKAQLAFLLNPVKIEQIIEIANSFEKMPHKSTFFFPKLLSGLVMFNFDHNEKII